MGVVLSIYGIGIIVAAILIVLFARYYIKYIGQSVNIEQIIIVCFLSWFIAIPMMIIYREEYKKLFTELFTSIDKNEEEEI